MTRDAMRTQRAGRRLTLGTSSISTNKFITNDALFNATATEYLTTTIFTRNLAIFTNRMLTGTTMLILKEVTGIFFHCMLVVVFEV